MGVRPIDPMPVMNRALTVPAARLFVWTDVEAAWERDFNRWYDREHMQERIAIPGFRCARRLRALQPCPRPWLALYDTDGLDVFRSDAYRHAFQNQSAWSRASFARMRDTQRRVATLEVDVGDGEGAALALFVLADERSDDPSLVWRIRETANADDVIRSTLMRTDAGLSAPIDPTAPAVGADAVVIVEATGTDVARERAVALAEGSGLDADAVHVFQTLWRLGR